MRPLDGIRVVDLTRLLPGAYATLLLADLGAEVVKLEDPLGGDGMRTLPAAADARSKPVLSELALRRAQGERVEGTSRSVYFELLNRNKKSLTLDLRSPRSTAVVAALAEWADVFVDSFRPSTARRLGVDGATLRARHPRLVCASITGFGLTGPYVEHAAHDINYQALAGLLHARPSTLRRAQGRAEQGRGATGSGRAGGEPLTLSSSNGEPPLPEPLIADIGSAMHTALGITAALFQRARTGEGAIVDVSIHEAALAWSMFPATSDLAGPCYTLYETADGQWLALGALEPKFWRAFCECIGRPDVVALQFARGDERTRLLQEVAALMRTETRAAWLERFAGVDACLTPVYTRPETEADPHIRSRGVLAHERGVVYVTPPGVAVTPAPELGAHTDEVLEAAGIDAAQRDALRAGKVI